MLNEGNEQVFLRVTVFSLFEPTPLWKILMVKFHAKNRRVFSYLDCLVYFPEGVGKNHSYVIFHFHTLNVPLYCAVLWRQL